MNNDQQTTDWVLILGGSSGIGLATAKKLAGDGFNICVIHRDRRQDFPRIEKDFEDIRACGVEFLPLHVNALSEAGTEKVLNQIQELGGSFRLLLHCITRGNLKLLADQNEKEPLLQQDDFQHTIQAMGLSLLNWTRALLDHQLFAPESLVLGLTSEGNQRVWPYYGAVSAAKAVLESVIRSMAIEFAPFGIRANLIQAGITDTPSMRMIPGSDQLKDMAKKRNPYGRLTKAEDVANVISLLIRPEAAWINGAIIPVDGGERLR